MKPMKRLSIVVVVFLCGIIVAQEWPKIKSVRLSGESISNDMTMFLNNDPGPRKLLVDCSYPENGAATCTLHKGATLTEVVQELRYREADSEKRCTAGK
jgi:hypothetical protein